MPAQINQKQNTPLIKQLILYISQEGQKYDTFGMTHLNKIMYAADFDCIRESGRSITGASYKKQNLGAVPFCMKPVLEEMLGQSLKIVKRLHITRIQKRPTPIEPPDTALVTPSIRKYLDRWIEALGPLSAEKVRDKFHEQAYWRILERGDTVPYSSTFWPVGQDTVGSDQDAKAAAKFHAKYGNKPIPRPTQSTKS